MWYLPVIERFRGVKPARRPAVAKACCPVHKGGGERTPSLYFGLGRDGRLLAHCFACNAPVRQIVEAVGLTMSDLFEDGQDKAKPRSAEEPKRRIVASYDYRDEAGNLLYQVCRFEPKAFVQRRPCPAAAANGGGRCTVMGTKGPQCRGAHDGWHWMLGDVRRVLYRLPGLLGKPDWPVIVVEGEKDADRLHGLGLVATCNVGGVGMGWQPEYSQALAGRRVAVVPDNDPAGWRHAWSVAGSLVCHGAASVRVACLPEPAKDVSDWLDGGGTVDGLVAMLRATPEWGPLSKAA
jgi:hypothetical protein